MLSTEDRSALLAIARASIEHGFDHDRPPRTPAADAAQALREERASFVTLKRHGQLRGCIGSLQAHRPLCEDVAHNAWAAAFRDHRFKPLSRDEWPGVAVELSLLTPPRPLTVASEADLLETITPGKDGLILQEGGRRATFLPAVWESLPEPRNFVRQLKRKAGMPADHWSDQMQVQVYSAEKIRE